LAKDLDVQGPSLPYDSVCVFLAKCLVVASQDVRLYRMQLEEKVLNWLVDSWRMENGQVGKSRMASHTVADMLALLEGICGFSNRSDLVCNILLPDCPITDTVVEQANTKVIRDFLLNARLPPSRRLDPAGPPAKVSTGPRPLTDRPGNLAEPIGRERKLSAFMLKSLDALILEWDGANNHSTAEKTRRSIDVAVMAITFESLLVLNGTRSNKRVMQAAGKLLIVIAPILTDSRWTMDELALVLLGFGPLIAVGREGVDFQKWEAMLHPGVGTGIKSETLRTLRSVITNNRDRIQGQRRDLQRIIWQDADVSLP
jgi:ataxia telangiectasia mutated family protein